MPELGKATVIIDLDTKKFNRGLKQAEKEFDRSTANMDKDTRKLSKSFAPVTSEVRKLGTNFKATFRDSMKVMKLARSEYTQHGAALARLNPAVKRLGMEHRTLTRKTVAMRGGLKLTTVALAGMAGIAVGLSKTLGGLAKAGVGGLTSSLKSVGGALGSAGEKIAGMGKMGLGLIVVIGAIIALLGPLMILVTALVGSLAAAAGAVGAMGLAFGAILIPIVATAVATISKFKKESEKAGTEANRLRMAAKGFGTELRKAFGPAANALMSGLTQGVMALRGTMTKLAPSIHKVGSALGVAFADFGKFLGSNQMTRMFSIFGNAAARTIPVFARGVERIAQIFGNIARASLPLFEKGLQGVVSWLGKIAGHTSNIGKTRGVIEIMVEHFRSWWNLLKSIGGAILAVFSAAEDGSKGFVDSLTTTINNFTKWAKTIEGKKKIRETFDNVADAVRTVGTALLGLISFGTKIFNFFSSGSTAAEAMKFAVIGIGTALAALVLGVGAPVAAIAGLVAAVVMCYLKFETFRHTVNMAMLSIASGVTGSVSIIIGALTQLLGAISSTLSGLSNIPGMGWAKDAARAIDNARDKLDGFRDSMTKTVANLAKQEATRHLKAIAKQVDELGRAGKDSSKKMAELRLLIEKMPAGSEKTAWLTALAQKAAGAKRPLEELAAAAEKAARTEKMNRLVSKVEELTRKGKNVGPAFDRARAAIAKMPEKDRSKWVDKLNSAAGRAVGLLSDIGSTIAGLTSKTIDIRINRRETVFKETRSAGSGKYMGGRLEGFATGGHVRAPTYVVGEESPRHPEWVIATNPAYRKDNLGYWQQAGHDLGVPGFAHGGSPHASAAGTKKKAPAKKKKAPAKKKSAPTKKAPAKAISPTRRNRALGKHQEIETPASVSRFDATVGELAENWAIFNGMASIYDRTQEQYFSEEDTPVLKADGTPMLSANGEPVTKKIPVLSQGDVDQRTSEITDLLSYMTGTIDKTIGRMETQANEAVVEIGKALPKLDGKIDAIVRSIIKLQDANTADTRLIGKKEGELHTLQKKKKPTTAAGKKKRAEQIGEIQKDISAAKGRRTKRNGQISNLQGRAREYGSARAQVVADQIEMQSNVANLTAPNSIPAAKAQRNDVHFPLAAELTDLSPDSVKGEMAKRLKDSAGGDVGTTDTGTESVSGTDAALVGLQQEIIRNLQRELSVGALQLPVFKQFVGSYASGTPYVPATGLAEVHQGEAIIPSSVNPFTSGANTDPIVSVSLSGSLDALNPHIEAVVNGKKAEIVKDVNNSIGRTVRQSLQVPGGRKL